MKRLLFCIPLLALAPLGNFLESYFSGLGTFSKDAGFVMAFLGCFLIPLLVPIVFVIVYKGSWIRRVILFIVVLFIQVSVFSFVPPRATAELMGIAHRLRLEFPPDQLRNCADQLLTKFHAKTLTLGRVDGDAYFPADDSAVVVADTELPALFRGHFQRVYIQPDSSTGSEVVIFALDDVTGFICGNRLRVPEYAFPIADGVEVYQENP